MFHQGDLGSGIQSAVQQSKSVVCFVRDDREESSKWEDEYLPSEELAAPLADKAVVLRLVAGTKEANYLSAMTPVTTYPTVVVISNGAVKEYITPGVSKEAFVHRLSAAVGTSMAPPPPPAPQEPRADTSSPILPADHVPMTFERHHPDGTTTTADQSSVSREDVQQILDNAVASADTQTNREAVPGEHDDSLFDDQDPAPRFNISHVTAFTRPTATATTTTTATNTATAPPPNVAAILAERRAREEARKAAEDEGKKQARAAAAARRKAEMDAAGPSPDPRRAAETKYALEAKKKREQAKAERARILKQIEDNRAEQKARAEEAKLAREAALQKMPGNPFGTTPLAPAVKRGDTCALQIRLFDGSTIRKTFSSKNTLGQEVREWINAEQQVAGSPYNFKQILAPQPSKTISAGEEEESLQDLGLVPNATLVLVPIKSYTEAYESSPSVPGLVTGVASAGIGLVGQAAGLLGSGLGWGARALGSVLGGTGTASAPASVQTDRRPSDNGRDTGREGTQFYNGNSTNFASRDDDDESRKRD